MACASTATCSALVLSLAVLAAQPVHAQQTASAPAAAAESPAAAAEPPAAASEPASTPSAEPAAKKKRMDPRKIASFMVLEIPWGWGPALLSGVSFLGTALMWANQAGDFPLLADAPFTIPTLAWRVGVGLMLLSGVFWGALAVALLVVPEIGLVRRLVTGNKESCGHEAKEKKPCC